MSDGDNTLNIAQLLVIVVVGFLIFRWYSSSASAPSGPRFTGSHDAATRVDVAAVEQISQMFPQLDRRDIMWDLSRNGNNIAATTERVLTGRALDTPPPSFQSPIPVDQQARPEYREPATAPFQPNLIKRYNLASKIRHDGVVPAEKAHNIPKWSLSRTERQRNLLRRREDMILAARVGLLEKDKGRA